jgi:hypothetical protein
MTKIRVKHPQRYAREQLWEKFNQHSGPITQMITCNAPRKVRLSLSTCPRVKLKGWFGDFDDNILSLYCVRGDAWILMSEWSVGSDLEVDGSFSRIAVTGKGSDAVAGALAIIEFEGEPSEVWTARLMGIAGTLSKD